MQQFISQAILTEYSVSTRGIVDGIVICDAAYPATMINATLRNLRSDWPNKPTFDAISMAKQMGTSERLADNLSGHRIGKRDYSSDDNLNYLDSQTAITLKSQTHQMQQMNRWFHVPVVDRGGHEG